MKTKTREEIQAEIADLRSRADSSRQMAAYADSRAARLDDERYADRLEAQARELEQQLKEAGMGNPSENKAKHGPFYAGNYGGYDVYYITADDRVRAVKNFTREQCEHALQRREGLQKSVERAIHARLRQLDKGEKS